MTVLNGMARLRRLPALHDPQLFNDRLLKLKADGSLYDPLRQFITDKEHVKSYVVATVGKEYTIPTIAIFRTASELENMTITKFPCVIKPTHMSGRILICKNRHSYVDTKTLRGWLCADYYRISREANYRFLERKIIVEEFFSLDGQRTPDDYKIFCFYGIPRMIEIDTGRFNHHTRNFYGTSWNRLPLMIKYPTRPQNDPKPPLLGKMLAVAAELSRPFSFLRVDLYMHSGKIKVGELTNCHGGGTELIDPPEAEAWLGALFSRTDADDS